MVKVGQLHKDNNGKFFIVTAIERNDNRQYDVYCLYATGIANKITVSSLDDNLPSSDSVVNEYGDYWVEGIHTVQFMHDLIDVLASKLS